jgi:hypothetical protein
MTLTLKNNGVLPLMMLSTCTMLYDPGYFDSFSILPTRLFYLVMLQPLKVMGFFPLMMLSKCTKLFDPEAYVSFSILSTNFFYQILL